jgi:2-methylisocitrate lyase-like PEP mutase family enzyme
MTLQIFRGLHQGPAVLVLPNAWDAGTARLIESIGAKAIATTSAGLAWSRGYPDGNALPIEQLVSATLDMARVIRVPLTVDVEAGYSADPGSVAELVVRVLDVGAVGINIEDGAASADILCKKIVAVREKAVRSGVDLFINARTDVYLRGVGCGDAAIEEVIHRASRYRATGCDGLFVPGLSDGDAMATIAEEIKPMPLNIMALPGLPSMDTLQKNGVRRLSAGSAIAQAALGCTSRLAAGFLAGAMGEMFTTSAEYDTVNKFFANDSRDHPAGEEFDPE